MMKKSIALWGTLCIVQCICLSDTAAAGTIALWTFESSVPSGSGTSLTGVVPEVGIGSASGFHASASTTYNNPTGNGSAEAFGSNNWAIGDSWQFQTTTTGYKALTISFDMISAGTGPRDFKIQTSTDGATWTDLGVNFAVRSDTMPAWNSSTNSGIDTVVANLPTSLNNLMAAYVRLVLTSTTSANGFNLLPSGAGRIDNVHIAGVPEPSTLAVFSIGCLLVSLHRMMRFGQRELCGR